MLTKFWSHTKQHSSKTFFRASHPSGMFWSHTKQHSSKTKLHLLFHQIWFWSHTKQHSSKTSNAKKLSFWFRNRATHPSKIPVLYAP